MRKLVIGSLVVSGIAAVITAVVCCRKRRWT